MLKNEFLRKVSSKTGVKKDDINVILKGVREVIVEALSSEDSIKIFDGITFTGTKVDKATRRNPATGESVIVPAHVKVKARFSNGFKEEVNR